MGKSTKGQLFARQREITNKLDETYTRAENEKRELTDEEKSLEKSLKREFENNSREITLLNQQAQSDLLLSQREGEKDKGAVIREAINSSRVNGGEREITLDYVPSGSGNTKVKDSGAVNLTIHDIIPTLNEGLGLPPGVTIVTGVTGSELYPVSVDDAEIVEVGETQALEDQNLDFSAITVTPGRIGLTVSVSNTAIDNAAFDLMGFVRKKFSLAVKKYFAKKLYSQAAFTGIHGPFKGLASSGDITLGSGAYAGILNAVADFTDKGFDASNVCLIMDAKTEADLKACQKGANTSGTVIENGKCAGYNYVVSHYINTTLSNGNLTSTPDRYLGIGYFEYLAVQTHGAARLSIDGSSKAVAVKNITALTLNMSASITDLSTKINNKNGTATQAFALYKIVAPTA